MHSPTQTALGWKVPPAVAQAPASIPPTPQAKVGGLKITKSSQQGPGVTPPRAHAPPPVQMLPAAPGVPPSPVHCAASAVQRQLVPAPQQTPAAGSSTAAMFAAKASARARARASSDSFRQSSLFSALSKPL